tara:strand:- start:385 stop:582 length:198 start_codon:yes stop_codon:yes gene_type:complete
MVYINDADISWSQSDADHAEAEHDSTPPTITPDDIAALKVEEYAKLIQALYEEQVALRLQYHTGE